VGTEEHLGFPFVVGNRVGNGGWNVEFRHWNAFVDLNG